MRRAALAAAALLAAAGPLRAQADTVPQDRVHVVRRGETLWGISQSYLNDPFLWPDIFRLNTRVVEDPARIYPNQRLVLPPGVVAQGPSSEHTIFYRDPAEAGSGLNLIAAGSGSYPVVRQGDFYRAGFVARDGEVRPLGRLAEVISPTVVPLGREPSPQVYDRVYVQTLPGSALHIGDRVQFLRVGRELPPNGRVWIPTGLGTVADTEDGVATVVIVRMFDAVGVNDQVVPVERFPVRAGVMPVASTGLQARVLAFQKAHPAQVPEEIAFLDVGRQAGVSEGDEFDVYIPREQRNWGTRPEIRVAHLQVVKVTERTASARITSLEQPAAVVGLPARRVAKMP